MSVGTQPSVGSINTQFTQLALQIRNLNQLVSNFTTQVNNLGAAGLEALGFATADATNAMTLAGYMSTLNGVYMGTVQQGGTGGTGAIEFDFDNALSALWAGQ